jgi:hypothetical protein
MGLRGPLPDHLLSKVELAERKKHKLGPTVAELQAHQNHRGELADHDQFIGFCNLKGIYYDRLNPTRKTTSRRGRLDFSLAYHGQALFLEFKKGTNKPTKEQEDHLTMHALAGNPAFVVNSVSAAIDLCYEYLPLKHG